MKVIIVTRDNTEYARDVETFMTDFRRQTGRSLDTLDPDTREGTSFCQTYDIVEYPTVIATTDDGQIVNSWSGLPLPTISEASFYG